jgi:hypothetical protein
MDQLVVEKSVLSSFISRRRVFPQGQEKRYGGEKEEKYVIKLSP